MQTNLVNFIRHTAEDMRLRGQYSAAQTCLSVLRGLLGIAGKPVLLFSELTPALLKNYEHHLLGRERSRNTVSLYMRMLQNLCNRATRMNLAQVPDDLFDHVFTGNEPVAHRAAPPEVIRKIRDAALTGKNSRLAFARDMFMLSFYLRGIPYIDLAHLRACDLRDGFICYRRSKTGRRACVKLEPCALEIIRRYASRAKDTPYLLPIIRRSGSPGDERRQYESALRLYNKHLNRLAHILDLGIRLTSYVARHSWATIAHDIGVDVADISAALCHSSEKMTRNYLRSFTPDRLASVNRRVLQAIRGNTNEDVPEKRRWKKEKIPNGKMRSGSL